MMAAPHIIVSATRSGPGAPSRPRLAARSSRRRASAWENVLRRVYRGSKTGESILHVLRTLYGSVRA
jgi:hypothetical protein